MNLVIQATGTEFVYGQVFSPSLADTTAVLHILDRYDLVVVPDENKVSVLNMDFRAVRRYLPQIIGNLGIYFDERIETWYWPEELEDQFRYLIWVLVCFNYRVNYGPRPAIPGVIIPRRVRTLVKSFRCPFCDMKSNVQPHESDSVRASQYLVWLTAHFVAYHQWFKITEVFRGYQNLVKKSIADYESTIKSRQSDEAQIEKEKEARGTKLAKHEIKLRKQVPNRELGNKKEN